MPRSAAAPDPIARPVHPLVPLMDPARTYGAWGPEAERVVLEVLRGHQYVRGPHVAALEAAFAHRVGVARAVAVDSGTDALTLVLRALFEDGDPGRREVILPAFTFVATASAVVNAGGVPVFADVDAETAMLDPAAVAAAVGLRTAAVIPVHLFGTPADVDGIRQAAGPGAFLLEDAAQAIDATWKGRRAGALGDAGIFSFYPSKNLGAFGDGGIVTTDDTRRADLVAALRDHGQTRKLYDHRWVGTNSRMDEVQAAVLRVKLPFLDAWTSERRAIAARYDRAFQGTAIRSLGVPPGAESARHLYTVRVAGRDRVRAALLERRVQTGVYYPVPLHLQPCFVGRRWGGRGGGGGGGGGGDGGAAAPAAACPVAERLALEVLSLPCFPGLSPEEQDRVIQAVIQTVGEGVAA